LDIARFPETVNLTPARDGRANLHRMVSLRSLAAADIPDADGVLRDAFHTDHSFARRLRRYLSIQPDGWLVAEEDGSAVGMVGAIDYGSFAYVGMMGVRRDRQGRGIGRRLLEALLAWMESRGIPCARLEATDEGRRLYRQLGFVDAGVSHELHLPSTTAVTSLLPDLTVEVARDPAQVTRLDATLFGADRERLWRWLFAAEAGRVLIARDRDGRAAGYLCVQEEVLGPWGAHSPEAADALLTAALPLVRNPRTRAMVPEQNAAALQLLLGRGWSLDKNVPHMSRGPGAAPPGWSSLYGKGSYCLG
jgi:GNAT superfamily N-acetyltransferase